jgi:antitoxin component YwqK of YwqJK toxin-antitoxin module
VKHIYKDGERDRLDTWWFEDGVKGIETHYKNGILEGLESTWYKTGKKFQEIHYKHSASFTMSYIKIY